MKIRPMNADETSLAADMLRRSFAEVAERYGLTVENCPKSPAFHTPERVMDDQTRGAAYWFLEEDRLVCGCVAMERHNQDVVYLERLAVLPEHRSKGFGKALVEHVLSRAKIDGVVRVEIGVVSENVSLKNWYGRFGFVETGTRRFDHLPFTVAFMARQL